MVDNSDEKPRKTLTTERALEMQKKRAALPRSYAPQAVSWDKLDAKLKTVLNRALNALLRREDLTKAEAAIIMNYDKLRQTGLKTANAESKKTIGELTDQELAEAAGEKTKKPDEVL